MCTWFTMLSCVDNKCVSISTDNTRYLTQTNKKSNKMFSFFWHRISLFLKRFLSLVQAMKTHMNNKCEEKGNCFTLVGQLFK